MSRSATLPFVSLLNPQPFSQGILSNPDKLPVQAELVEISGQPFKKVLQVRTEIPTAEWWALQYIMKTAAPVKKGDALLATFYMRCLESQDETGEAYVRAMFQVARPPYNKSLVTQCAASRRWRKIQCPFTAVANSKAGMASFNFAFPTGPQVVQMSEVTIANYGPSVQVDALPKSEIVYAGRERNASWRDDADRRIDQIRKGDLRVVVRRPDGKPVPGARVLVNMTRHAFPFGAAVAVAAPNGRRFGTAYNKRHWFTQRDEQEYDYWLKRWFTKATPEIALMPNGWHGVWPHLGRQVALDGVKRYQAMGFNVRGHILVWPGWKWFRLPGIEAAKKDPKKLRRMVLDHITDETSALSDWIDEWTLLNEPFAHHDLMDVLGDDAMVDWFNAGHAANPRARLYINDYSILSGGGLDLGHQDHYAKTIKFLLDQGAPLHGIGMQSHFGEDPTAPEKVYQILNRFAAFGREIKITEFDINSRDTKLQADYTRDFMTICFSHPAIVGFSMWGFWEKAHWRPDAALLDKDWNIKPNGEAYEQLVLHDWWTEEELVTDTEGICSTRGFLGDYRISIIHNGTAHEHVCTLKPGSNKIKLTLDEKIGVLR